MNLISQLKLFIHQTRFLLNIKKFDELITSCVKLIIKNIFYANKNYLLLSSDELNRLIKNVTLNTQNFNDFEIKTLINLINNELKNNSEFNYLITPIGVLYFKKETARQYVKKGILS